MVDAKADAKKTYDEAIKAKNTAVLAERASEDKETMSVKIGQLQPNTLAVLSIQLLHVLTIEQGAFCYHLPFGIYPEFEKHKSDFTKAYDFSFEATITS